jgi:Fe2+ or Zn2+ uptake regulation protein
MVMMIETFAAQLRAQGYRITPQRLAILRILQQADRHLLPAEIYQRARETIPGLTVATVYRTLSFLTEMGLVLAAHIGSGQMVYEIGGIDHHHLICRVCGMTHQIDHSLLQDLYDRFEERTGFQIDSVHTTFFGLCPECQHEDVT